MQGAFCCAPNGGRRGRAQPSAMARSLRRIARIDAPLGSPSVTSRRRRPPTAVGSGQAKASASGQGAAFASGQKLPSPTRRQKRQRRSPCDASRQIYFIAWVVCAREMMAPTFWLRSIRAGNRFSGGFRLQRRQLNGNPDVFVSQTGRKYRKATCPLRLVAL